MLAHWLELSPNQKQKLLLLTLNLLLACIILMLTRTLTTAIFLSSYDISYLPWLFAVQAILVASLSIVQASLIGKIKKSLEISILLIVFISFVIFGYLAMQAGLNSTIFLFTVLLQTAVDLVLIEVSIIQTNALNAREARKIQPYINAGGTVGGIIAGAMAAALSDRLGTENLLLTTIIFCLALYFCSLKIIKSKLHDAPSIKKTKQDKSIIEQLLLSSKHIFQDKLMLIFLSIFAMLYLASTLIEFQFKAQLKKEYNTDEISTYLGYFFLSLNICTLLFQLFISKKLMQWLSFSSNMLLMPIVMLVGMVGFIIYPYTLSLALTQFFELLTKNSVFRETTSLVFLPFNPTEQGRLRIIIGGIIAPISVLIASLTLVALSEHLSPLLISVLSISFILVAILAIIKLYPPYLEKLNQSLSDRQVRLLENDKLKQILSKDLSHYLNQMLDSKDNAKVCYALELIDKQALDIKEHALFDLLHSENLNIQKLSLNLIIKRELYKSDKHPLMQNFLSLNTDNELRAGAYCYLIQTQNMQQAPMVNCQESIATGQQKTPVLLAQESWLNKLDEEVQSKDINRQLTALSVIKKLQLTQYKDYVLSILKQQHTRENKALIQSAIVCAASLKAKEFIPYLIDNLQISRFHYQAKDSLKAYAQSCIEPLATLLQKPKLSAHQQQAIYQILTSFKSDKALELLIQQLNQQNHFIKLSILKRISHYSKLYGLKKNQRNQIQTWVLNDLKALGHEIKTLQQYQLKTEPKAQYFLGELKNHLGARQQIIFSVLAAVYPNKDCYKLWLNYASNNTRLRANSLELLEHFENQKLIKQFMPVLELNFEHPQLSTDTAFDANRPNNSWLIQLQTWVEKRLTMNTEEQQLFDRIYSLKQINLFASLSAEQIMPLAKIVKPCSFVKGETIFRDGEVGEKLYLILNGQVKIQRQNQEIAILGENEAFGEMALLDPETPRSADAIALNDCESLSINYEDFNEILDEYPAISQSLIKVLSRRLRNLLINTKSDNT